MHRRTRGILAAAFFIIFFVALPRVALSMLPAEFSMMLGMTGFDLEGLVLSLTFPGVLLAALALAGGFASARSPVSLAVSIVSQLVWFYLLLFVITLGRPMSFGQAEITGGGGPAAITFILDMRFFVAISAVILGLKMAKTSLDFLSTRRLPPPEPSRETPPAQAPETTQPDVPPSTAKA